MAENKRLGYGNFECGCYYSIGVLYLCDEHKGNLKRLMRRARQSPWGPWPYKAAATRLIDIKWSPFGREYDNSSGS